MPFSFTCFSANTLPSAALTTYSMPHQLQNAVESDGEALLTPLLHSLIAFDVQPTAYQRELTDDHRRTAWLMLTVHTVRTTESVLPFISCQSH